MSYSPENFDTYFYVDDWGMVLTKPLWEGDGTVDGVPNVGQQRDSISRTAMAYKAWGDIELVYATRSCVLPTFDSRGEYWKAYRHPDNRDEDMSRDHILGLLLAEKFAGNTNMLKIYTKHFRWRISNKFCFTPDLWAWMKMLAGKWWWWVPYIVMTYPWMLYNVFKNKIIYKIGKFSPEVHHLNWYPQWAAKYATKKQVVLRRKLFPAYVLEQFAWQLYVLPQNVFVRGLQKLALKITSRYNYLVRLLLGDDTVKKIDVSAYKTMTSWRFGVVLNESCQRHVEIVRKEEMIAANRLEEDLLKKIWDEQQRSKTD